MIDAILRITEQFDDVVNKKDGRGLLAAGQPRHADPVNFGVCNTWRCRCRRPGRASTRAATQFQNGEACDDGNRNGTDGDGCSRDCKVEPGFTCVVASEFPARSTVRSQRPQYPLLPLASFTSVARTCSDSLVMAWASWARPGLQRLDSLRRHLRDHGRERQAPARPGAGEDPRGYALTVLGNIGYDFRLSSAGPLFTDFTWRPTNPVGASPQVFQLRPEVANPYENISASLLLAVLFPEKLRARPDWHWRRPRRPLRERSDPAPAVVVPLPPTPAFFEARNSLANRLFFTFGPGFRLDNAPLVNQPYNTIVVPVTAGTTPTAPTLTATHLAAYGTFSVGLALDLGPSATPRPRSSAPRPPPPPRRRLPREGSDEDPRPPPRCPRLLSASAWPSA